MTANCVQCRTSVGIIGRLSGGVKATCNNCGFSLSMCKRCAEANYHTVGVMLSRAESPREWLKESFRCPKCGGTARS